jgi:hypothetical protein
LQLKNIFIFLSPSDVRPFRQYQAVSIQDGHRESLQSTINSTQQQQLLEAASRVSYPPRLPTVGSGCGQQQMSQKDCSRRFGLDRGAWQAGLVNKCKLAEECRAASEKVHRVLPFTFCCIFFKILFHLALSSTLFLTN